MIASTSVPKSTKKRHYYSVSSIYLGKSVDNKTIILHKFPADERLRKAWMRCIKIVMPQFAYNIHDCLCSAHFLAGKFTQEHNFPSVFNMRLKRKIFAAFH
ncbi:hypothetical protein CHS0354_006270 [Potamilus streckersoni]|uniref:THAP-type domain-containing protein n=1 Tax=Potamilus streckersoni TaxID=2493646 RepID=A0AAE0SMU2_9BIVA|nr:hypothetical protein CHS0354_006270 [Potamilus streckersoni]